MKEAFPSGARDPIKESLLYRELNGNLLSSYVIASMATTMNYLMIIHYQQAMKGRRGVSSHSLLELRIEPGEGVNVRKASEEAWRRISRDRALTVRRYRPRLHSALIVGGRSELLSGCATTIRNTTIGNSELRLPLIVGFLTAVGLGVLLLAGALPQAQLPSMWWTAVQMLVPFVAAAVVAFLVSRNKGIAWSVV